MNFIKNIIDNWDPIDLLLHAPDDEYYLEIEKIEHLLNSTDDLNELAEGIFKVFEESFGEEIFVKSKDECKKIAQILLSAKLKTGDGKTGDGTKPLKKS